MWWAQDWDDPKDCMHHQMGYDTWNNPRVADFIKRKIRPDGFSTFRRGDAPAVVPGLNADTLADAMGNRTGVDYAAMLQPYRAACDLIEAAGNLNRLAMFAAQIGHESGGLQYMEEIASGEAYEGRADLGNTQPGDGVRFKGRGPLQITGRHNYGQLSQWAFSKQLVPSPTFFVDQPAQLGVPQYGFLGAVWYWMVARPNINQMCDAGDILGVTKAINGGTNGLDDRTNRWNHALGMGLAALDISGADTTGDDMAQVPQDQWNQLFDAVCSQRPSLSPLRPLAQGNNSIGNMRDVVDYIDGSEHWQAVKAAAELGHPTYVALLREIAGADRTRYPDRQDDAKLAQAILADIDAKKARPQFASVTNEPPPAQPQVVYVPAPQPEPVAEPSTAVAPAVNGADTGKAIGDLYNVLERLKLADALPIEGRAPLAALIAVLNTKNGSQIS
jgi:putative chitinase